MVRSVMGQHHPDNASFTAPIGRQFSNLVHLQINPGTDNNVRTGAIARKILCPCQSMTYRLMSSDSKSTSQTPEEDEASSSESDSETDILEEEESEEQKIHKQIAGLKDQLLRALAEQENIRRIAKRDVDNSKAFAVTSFAKSLLDTSDNLSRALEAVPPEHLGGDNPVLANLYKGIELTNDGLTKAFAKNGLVKFGADGDTFDPNLHEALFEYAEEGKEVGTVGQIMKVGFKLNKRVIRPAEVGVIKKS